MPRHLPIPIVQQVDVISTPNLGDSTIGHNSSNTTAVGKGLLELEQAIKPNKITHEPNTALHRELNIVEGFAISHTSYPNRIILTALPIYPGLEISFVSRVFGTAGGKTVMLKENRTPWSFQNAVEVTKPDIRRIQGRGGKLIIQYAAELRVPHSTDPPITYLLNTK
ncbi:MAG: hypothetical protein LBJ95_04095 [Oscillospiraceae bacterium]|jgi:hypothetical protein|nr:hypothetical protein [Oscillospiraceae bacterium]